MGEVPVPRDGSWWAAVETAAAHLPRVSSASWWRMPIRPR